MSFDLLAQQLTRESLPHQVTGRPKLPAPKRDAYGKGKNPWKYTERQLCFLAEIVERGSIELATRSLDISRASGDSLLVHMTRNSGIDTTILKVIAYVRWADQSDGKHDAIRRRHSDNRSLAPPPGKALETGSLMVGAAVGRD